MGMKNVDFNEKEQKARKKKQTDRLAQKAKAVPTVLFDPVVSFGKYKEEGLKLSELPRDYLDFLTSPTPDGSDFVHKGINWCEVAKGEIKRRDLGLPISERASLPIEDENVVFAKGSLARAKTERIEPSVEAFDGAAKFLLKDFITRSKKEQTFSDWLSNYAQEAVRYGTLKGTDVVNPTVDILLVDYRSYRLEIRVAKARLTLLKVILDE